jgi:hypothetical protein
MSDRAANIDGPVFDKAEYKRRRQAGMRGQTGPYLRARHGAMQLDKFGHPQSAEVGGKPVSKKARLKNSKRARKEQI